MISLVLILLATVGVGGPGSPGAFTTVANLYSEFLIQRGLVGNAAWTNLFKVDSDGDGYTDLQELLNGTDPNTTTSHLATTPFNNAPVGLPGTIELEMYDIGWWANSYDASDPLAARYGSKFRKDGVAVKMNSPGSFARANQASGTNTPIGYSLSPQPGQWTTYSVYVPIEGEYFAQLRAKGTGSVVMTLYSPAGTLASVSKSFSCADWQTISSDHFYLPQDASITDHAFLQLTAGSGVNSQTELDYLTIVPYISLGSIPTNTTTIATNSDLSDANKFVGGTNLATALHNAVALQNAINARSGGGHIVFPAGEFYISQTNTVEKYGANNYWYRNIDHAATVVTNGNLSFEGASGGTTLRAFNRMTTLMFFNGWTNGATSGSGMQNILFTNLTFVGRPELTAANTADPEGYGLIARWTAEDSGGNRIDNHWDFAPFAPEWEAGDLIAFRGNSTNGSEGQQIKTVEFASCTFSNPPTRALYFAGCRDVNIHDSKFLDGCTDIKLQAHLAVYATRTCHYTTNETEYLRDNNYRFSLHNNVFNGGTPISDGRAMMDGIFWGTVGGGFHIADNVITNYTLEGVQMNAGPGTVVRNNYKTDATKSPVALLAYQSRQANELMDGVGGSPASNGLTTAVSPYSVFSFVDNSVQGGLVGVKGAGDPINKTNYTVGKHTAASDYVVSGNTISLMTTTNDTLGMNLMPARNVIFAGNQVLNAKRGVQYSAGWNTNGPNFATNICRLTVMCNDFTGLTEHVVFDQGLFPLVDYLRLYANKMGGSQSVKLESIYQNPDGSTLTSTYGAKARVAIVGNSYSGSPSSVTALKADFAYPEFTSIGLFKLDLTNSVAVTMSSGNEVLLSGAPDFTDMLIWPLY